jgi:RNA polymerase sigma-70 factor (ECF subfamily)
MSNAVLGREAMSGALAPDMAFLLSLAEPSAPPRRGSLTEVKCDPADLRDVQLSLRGDDNSFDRLVKRYQGDVARQMWRFTRDREEHAELIQEVFIAAFTSLHTFRGRGSFANWLRSIAVRTGYAFWRSRRRNRAEPRADIAQLIDERCCEEAPDDAIADAEVVHQVLAQLAPRDRLVLTLMYLEDRSVAEVAELTGWSQSMVKVQAWRARGKLRKLLGDG